MTEAFLNCCQAKKLRPKTIASYEQTMKLFARWLEEEKGIQKVEEISEKEIQGYILDLQQRGKYTYFAEDVTKAINYPLRRRDYRQTISNTTINNYLRNMRVFFTWLAECDYIVQSPMRRIKALPEERKPREFLEDDEVKKLLKNMDKSYCESDYIFPVKSTGRSLDVRKYEKNFATYIKRVPVQHGGV